MVYAVIIDASLIAVTGFSLLAQSIKYLRMKQCTAKRFEKLRQEVENNLTEQLKATPAAELKQAYLNEALVCLFVARNKQLDDVELKQKLKSIDKATKKKLMKTGQKALKMLQKEATPAVS